MHTLIVQTVEADDINVAANPVTDLVIEVGRPTDDHLVVPVANQDPEPAVDNLVANLPVNIVASGSTCHTPNCMPSSHSSTNATSRNESSIEIERIVSNPSVSFAYE